ncbi:uncharacterized protein LOC141598938 [Silene latifolia]|uniref:uncharacterized protein LOC141598938 n=1 Tax=Silene latifolia TaxID=37657 RepID=UPI003D77638C
MRVLVTDKDEHMPPLYHGDTKSKVSKITRFRFRSGKLKRISWRWREFDRRDGQRNWRNRFRSKSILGVFDVQAMCPGFWLTEINADMYKVNEQIPDDAKRS